VLLLLILALLAMFGLVAVTFVLLTGQAQRSAKSIERIGQTEMLTGSSPRVLLQQAAMQVFRGPVNNASVMRAHSLLEDIYGNEYVYGTVAGAAVVGDGTPNTLPQLVDITLDMSLTAGLRTNKFGTTTVPATTDDRITNTTSVIAQLARRVGCVLTITYVPTTPTTTAEQLALKGQSTRIVAADTTAPKIQVVAFPNGALPPANSTFTINGVPFSGTGFGFDPSTDKLDLKAQYHSTDKKWEIVSSGASTKSAALLPNLPLTVYSILSGTPVTGVQNFRGNPPGGSNSDYTAADFQHMLLAAQVVNGTTVQTLPSFHRPALVRYWGNANNGLGVTDFTSGTTWSGLTVDKVALLRQIMLRPIGSFAGGNADHPNFTGSNASFNPAWDGVTANQGQWDVDNDGDGVADSVWVDLGMPVRSTSDGRLYKPLFAILCVDLDGRLNLNAHGCLAQTVPGLFNADGTPAVAAAKECGLYADNMLFANADGTGAKTAQLARGQGAGPAEVTLAPLFPSLIGTGSYQNLLIGTGTLDGRYAEVGAVENYRVPGKFQVENPLVRNRWYQYDGLAFVPDPSSWNWWLFQQATDESTYKGLQGAYGVPPDTMSIGAVGVDIAGRPMYLSMGGSPLFTTVNTPYDMDLSAKAARGLSSPTSAADNPFGPAELERILRPFDRDAASLPSRLALLTAATPGNPTTSVLIGKRRAITTDSWDVPTQYIHKLVEKRVSGGLPASVLAGLLPPDILAGLKMDLGRPLDYGTGGFTTRCQGQPRGRRPAPVSTMRPTEAHGRSFRRSSTTRDTCMCWRCWSTMRIGTLVPRKSQQSRKALRSGPSTWSISRPVIRP
jgi:hypothetical protein